MQRATIRLESVERKLDGLNDAKIRIEHLEQDMDRYHP
jgi:hypothetical protein